MSRRRLSAASSVATERVPGRAEAVEAVEAAKGGGADKALGRPLMEAGAVEAGAVSRGTRTAAPL